MSATTIKRAGRRACPVGHDGDSVTWTDYRVEERDRFALTSTYRVTLRDAEGVGRILERDGELYTPGADSHLVLAILVESGYPGREITVTDEHEASAPGNPVVLVSGELVGGHSGN